MNIKKIKKAFIQEFGIHFEPDELRFALGFIEDVIREVVESVPEWQATTQPLIDYTMQVKQWKEKLLKQLQERL